MFLEWIVYTEDENHKAGMNKECRRNSRLLAQLTAGNLPPIKATDQG